MRISLAKLKKLQLKILQRCPEWIKLTQGIFFVFCLSTPALADSLSKIEKRKLFKDFKKTQAVEMKNLREAHRYELRDLSQKQKDELIEWEKTAREKRREFFKQNRGNGKIIREYVKKERHEHDLIRKKMAQEKRFKREELDRQRKMIRAKQLQNLSEFKNYLKRDEKPPQSLWSPL